MEYRETPRIAAKDARLDGVIEDPGSRSRFARFEFVRGPRSIDASRVALVAAIVLGGMTLVGYVGFQSLRAAVRWLHQQPQYQLSFLDLQLRDPPPPWIRGGREAFLRQVRERAREQEVLPIMDLEPGRLEWDFKQSPWVDNVTRVEFPPQTAIVHVVYKQPVAVMASAAGERVYLDRKGHILPADEIDLQHLGPIVRISGRELAPSPENRPGGVWKAGGTETQASRLQRCVLGACKMAGFLLEPPRADDAAAAPSLHFTEVVATDPRGLFLRNVQGTMVLWGEAPDDEPSGSPDASEKWEVLRKWADKRAPMMLPAGDYWALTASGMKHAGPGQHH